MYPELQKRADRADQSMLIFLAGANFLGKAREKLCYVDKLGEASLDRVFGGRSR